MPKIGRIQKLTPAIGAEILDVDLRELSDDLVAEIRAAMLDNLVIFFRDQKLTIEQHKELGRRFGKLHVHFAVVPKIPAHPEIIVIEADENTTSAPAEVWHSDATADPEPPLGSLLYMREVPTNGGGDTMFANMYSAYDALSEPMKHFLADKTALHDGEFTLRGQAGIDTSARRFPISEHPLIRTHPETKRKSIYVNRVYTTRIPQLSQHESDAVLAMLYAHMEAPAFQCRFKWQAGSIAFWDNRCTLHRAVWDFIGFRRYAERVTICGDRPS